MSKIQADKLYNQRCPTCGQTISQPRSTGERSQNNCTHGDCDSIAKQVKSKKWTAGMVYDLMKYLAVQEGVYPAIEYRREDGVKTLIPLSQSEATMAEVAGLQQVINRFADEHNYWLWRYTDDRKKYKCIGGRTLEEMKKDYPGFNKEVF